MTDKEKEQIAIFRFGVIFPLLEKQGLAWGEQKKLLQQLSQREWEIPFSERTRIGSSTILNWLRRYREDGERIEALMPSDRSDCGRPRSIKDETLAALLQIRKEKPSYTIKKVVEEAYRRKIITTADRIALPTIYRLFRIHDQKTKHKQEDMRRFEVELSNDLWQADALHAGKVMHEGRLRKSYLYVILDDKSRLVVGSGFYLRESAESFIDCLTGALKMRGVPRLLYVDNASSFRNHRLSLGCAALQISLRHATAYRPEGTGKVERFNRTVRMQFLPDIPEGIALDDLNEQWQRYLDEHYHQRRHSSTGQSPLQRYLDDAHLLRGAPEKLPDYFCHRQERTVANDRTIRLGGCCYQVPLGLAGKRVELRYESLDRVELFFEGVSHGFIEEVPLHANSNRQVKQRPSACTQGGQPLYGGLPMMRNIRHFFSLKADPFPHEILTKNLYQLPSLEPMQQRIRFAISMRSFSLVTGDVGSGKSTSLRYVVDNLPKGEHEVLMFTAGSYTMAEFLRQVLLCFGIVSNSYKMSLMMRQVQEQLLEIHGRRVVPVLVIDEAHMMRPEVFSYLHLLTQYKLDSSPLVNTVLCGQEGLLDKLMTPGAKPLASRIMGRSHLEAIRQEVMEKYIAHHLRLAGSKKDIFSDAAVTAIHQGSGGLLSRANNLARGAMLAAALEKSQVVAPEHVRMALTEII